MNTNTMKMMIAAAALVVAAGSASAQTFKAEVPVAFQVGNKTMAPGSYDVRLSVSGAGATVVVVVVGATVVDVVVAVDVPFVKITSTQ